MHSPTEQSSASSRAEREILDEALFCTDRSFDPAELSVYLPPVPKITPQIPVHSTVPEYLTAPIADYEYPVSPFPTPNGSEANTCGSVSDAGGSFEFTNLAPGLYEVRHQALPTEPMTPEHEPEEPIPTPSMPERPDLRIEVNTGLSIGPGEKVVIGADVLRIVGTESPVPIDLMLLSPPMFGAFLRDDFAMTGGDVFTQEDIDRGRVSYRHEGDAVEGSDHFSFASPEGEIPPTQVEIQIVIDRRAPRLLGVGRLDRITRGMTVSAILDEQADADGECGLAVTGVAGTGTWAYSLDEGKSWRSLSNARPGLALLLGPADRLRFTPRLGVDTIARLSYRAWDRSSHAPGDRADLARHTVVGGMTAFSLEITNSSLRIESLTAPAKRKVAQPWDTPLTGADLIESGVAIVRLAGPGTWQFSADGSTWRDCKTVYHGRALLLPSEVQIRFVPQPEAKGKASLSLRSWDGDEDDGGGHTNLAARSSVGDGTRFGATIESWSWSFGGA